MSGLNLRRRRHTTPRGTAAAALLLVMCLRGEAHDGPHAHAAGDGHDQQALVATGFQNEVRITTDAQYRYIAANGIPDHQPGTFPNRGNPNSIRPQNYHYRVPLHPRVAEQPTPLRHQPFGVALNGVPFDPATAEFWRGDPNWNIEAMTGKINLGLDSSNAHVQPSGAYHYHGVPLGFIQLQMKKQRAETMTLVGYAADGFPMYGPLAYFTADDPASPLKKMTSSYRIKAGMRPSGPGGKYDGTYTADWEFVSGSGDLDECNGRTGVTPENPEGTYYYVLTETFPFIPRQFRGAPDASFDRHGPGPGGGRMGPPGGPPGRGGPPLRF